MSVPVETTRVVDSAPFQIPTHDADVSPLHPGAVVAEGQHAWFPKSPCGEHCHNTEDVARFSGLLVILKVLRLLWAAAVVLVCGVVAAFLPRLLRRAYLRWAAGVMLWGAGVRIEIEDRRPYASRARGLVVANHISFLDILAVARVHPSHFVAKSEVAGIPVISTLARRFGVILIERSALRGLPDKVGEATAQLQRDSSVAVFPEGTTWCGSATGRFRPAFFQAAIDAGVPVIPIRVSFTAGGHRTGIASFIGEDGPADTLGRVLRTREIAVQVRIHESQLPMSNRRDLAARCEALIAT